MKILSISLILMTLLFGAAFAQDANVRVKLSWDLGPEQDIGKYQLYVSPTCVDTEYGATGDPVRVSPLDPDQEQRISTEYAFYAPPEAETERCFKVTAIDNNGNESAPSSAIKFRVDKLPPGIPLNLSAEEITLSQ